MHLRETNEARRARRRRLALSSLLGLIVCGSSAEWGCTDGTQPRRPHVIVYLIDALRSDHLGIYGYGRSTSPVIDALARESVVFDRAYAPASWTKPSVGSLFTGLFPSRHGAERRNQRLRPDVPTLAELLREHGYATAAFLANPNVFPVFGFGRGFDVVREVGSFQLPPNAEDVHAAAFQYLEQRPHAPLFVYVHTIDPHHPYDPPPPFDRAFSKDAGQDSVAQAIARYDGEIAYADRELGRFLEVLRESGIYDDALFVLLSDHGEEFGEHGFFFHGRTLFEEQVRVPLLIRFPRARFAGTRIETPVRTLDLLPTVADWLGLETPRGVDGVSLLPLLQEPVSEYVAPLFAELDMDQNVLSSLVEGDYKLIERRSPLRERGVELFNIERDPGERNDLSRGEPARTARLRERLAHIASTASGGLHLQLTNAARGGRLHRVKGSVEVVDGGSVHCEPYDLERRDRFEPAAEAAIVHFELELRNVRNPAGTSPRWFVDTDRVRCRTEPADARFRIALSLDGREMTTFPLALGEAPNASPQPMPFEASAGDVRIVSRSGSVGPVPAGDEPFARLFAVPQVDDLEVEIDAALEARLRVLGYLGDGLPEAPAPEPPAEMR